MTAEALGRTQHAKGAKHLRAAFDAQPEQAAVDADLVYVNDAQPGISRRKAGQGFSYVDAGGARITDSRTLARIKKLAIPPAWMDVWIAPIARGHIQATGRDARGRKQYRYHERWRAVRDQTKYEHSIAGLKPEEAAVLAVLRDKLKSRAENSASRDRRSA